MAHLKGLNTLCLLHNFLCTISITMEHPTVECCEVNDVDRAFRIVWKRLQAQRGSEARFHHLECPQAQRLRRRRDSAGLLICVRFEKVCLSVFVFRLCFHALQ